MTALRVVPDDAVTCLLCGHPTATWVDLCDPCAGVVQGIADRVAGEVIAARVTTLDVVRGQLELEADTAVADHWWVHRPGGGGCAVPGCSAAFHEHRQ